MSSEDLSYIICSAIPILLAIPFILHTYLVRKPREQKANKFETSSSDISNASPTTHVHSDLAIQAVGQFKGWSNEKMEIVFQNKIEDFQAFCNYVVKETDQGKTFSIQAFRYRQVLIVMASLLMGALRWATSVQWQLGLRTFIVCLLIGEIVIFAVANFKPLYYEGILAYKRGLKSMTPRDLQAFQLPTTLTIDDNWLEIRSTEMVYRKRWRRVDQIGLTPNFIFIQSGWNTAYIIPRRDFSSEQSFIEFGKKLMELKEKNKNEAIGAE